MHDYLLPDGPRKKRLGEISGETSLDGEIRAARLVAEEMLQAGNPAAQAVLATIGRLCERDQAMALRSRALLTANQLQSLMKWVGDCLTETAREFLPEQDAMRLLDRFQERWTKAFTAFRQEGQIPKLTSEARKEYRCFACIHNSPSRHTLVSTRERKDHDSQPSLLQRTIETPNAATVKEYERLLYLAGLRDSHRDRGFHSGIKAVSLGDAPADVVAALVRNRPECFDSKLAQAGTRMKTLSLTCPIASRWKEHTMNENETRIRRVLTGILKSNTQAAKRAADQAPQG